MFHNKILMITVTVWALAQLIKVIVGVITERRFNFRWFVGTGGMPSSHAAGASAMATACGLQAGFESALFGVATVFAIVTMFDAQGVRRATGHQAAILNNLLDNMYEGRLQTERLKELIGHTPLQVLAGGAMGIILGYCLYYW